MLSHLLASDDLSEALVELLFEENLRLRPTYKDLIYKLGVVHGLLTPALGSTSASHLLSLGARPFAIATASTFTEDVICKHGRIACTVGVVRKPVALHRDSLCREACDPFVLLATRCFAHLSGCGVTLLKEGSRVLALPTLALEATFLHVVAELFVEHHAGHLDALRAVEGGIRLALVFLFARLALLLLLVLPDLFQEQFGVHLFLSHLEAILEGLGAWWA